MRRFIVAGYRPAPGVPQQLLSAVGRRMPVPRAGFGWTCDEAPSI